MKKTYRIRKNSPMYYIINVALPVLAIMGIVFVAGLLNSYDIAHGIMPR